MKSPKILQLGSAALALAMGLGCPLARAATASGTLAVTATVLSTCVVTPAALVFGNYAMAQTDAQGSIVVTCTPDVASYTVGLEAGTGSGATVTNRSMTGALSAGTLSYGLYSDAGRSTNWGNTASGTTVASSAGTGTVVKTFTVYGRIPANQTTGGGSTGGVAYTDTVQITVTY